MNASHRENFEKLLDALKQAKEEKFNYHTKNWNRCVFGVYSKYVLRKGSDEWTVDDVPKVILENFGMVVTSFEGEDTIFGHIGGPPTLDEAIARVEKLLEKEGVKEVGPSLRVKMKVRKGVSWNDLHKNDTFRYMNELWVKISDKQAFNYNHSVLGEIWQFGAGIEKTKVEIVEL